jgi:tetratricopeptide (TPR) repeat protein
MTPKTLVRLAGIVLALSGPLLAGGGSEAPGDEAALASQLESARQSGRWGEAGDIARQLLAAHPQSWEYLRGLAESQFHAAQFADAQPNYAKAVDALTKASGDTERAALLGLLIDEGDCLRRLGKFAEAVEVYDRAAPLSPDPGSFFFNLCTAEYVRKNKEQALVFADKTIKADPKHADAYYIKGSLLADKGKSDPDTGRFVLPDGTVEALKKYLELKPNGSHANAVRNMLSMFEQQ